MAQTDIRYDHMIEEALRGVVRRVLRQIAKTGSLPGDHHFFLSFKTKADGVKIADFLVEQYPDEMTIVLQHQFWDLKVEEQRFSVTLSFNDVPQPLLIPFAAVTSFADPAAQFGLQFQHLTDAETESEDAPEAVPLPVKPAALPAPALATTTETPEAKKAEDDGDGDDDGDGGDKVVVLDRFRRK